MYKRLFESGKKRHLRELNNQRCNRYYHSHKTRQNTKTVVVKEEKKEDPVKVDPESYLL